MSYSSNAKPEEAVALTAASESAFTSSASASNNLHNCGVPQYFWLHYV